MPGSQLKRLKASLKSAGVIGQPQQSKKTKKQQKQGPNGTTNSDSRLTKETALQSIREEFNPFEIKKNREKYSTSGGKKVKGVVGRPGISKQAGEEIRRNTLLVEMKKRNKAGGIIDKRFGENDPSMNPEDKMLERFTRERQQRSRGADIFNIEDDVMLTHYGQSLGANDNFDNDLPFDSDDEDGMGMLRNKKRPLALEDGGQLSDEEQDPDKPPRKKSKAEVMKEVIAKSKFHKFERQQEKNEDEDLREELDAELGDLRALLAGIPAPKSKPQPKEVESAFSDGQLNPERLAHINSVTDVNKAYDTAVREMTYDRRSKPSDRTKTAEELAEERASKLEKLERNRLRRMRGEESEDEGVNDEEAEEDDEFGLGKGVGIAPEEREFLHGSDEESGSDESEEEVDSAVDESDVYPPDIEETINGLKAGKQNTVADDADFSDDYQSDASSIASGDEEQGSEDESEDELASAKPLPTKSITTSTANGNTDGVLAYTYPCPQSLKEFHNILRGVEIKDVPTVVHRIRVLHHASLHPDNKGKLGVFMTILLDYILWIVDEMFPIPFDVVETLTRHTHSLTKVYPQISATAFRGHLQIMHSSISSGKPIKKSLLILLLAISTIYPTSDHFHLVVSPAILVMAKYLENNPPVDLYNMAAGAYIVTLCAQYQELSKRVVPEALNFIYQGLMVLAPLTIQDPSGSFPIELLKGDTADALRIRQSQSRDALATKLRFNDIFTSTKRTSSEEEVLKSGLAYVFTEVLVTYANLYAGKSAFLELFNPSISLLSHYTSSKSSKHLPSQLVSHIRTTTLPSLKQLLAHAQHVRRPLELHHHRPLPIPTNIPKFDEGFNPDRHKASYDPDTARKEMGKLKAEHKKERKGALRELRKDASFVAREKLKERREADAEYHTKMARIVGQIQADEGKASNDYEREKDRRKRDTKAKAKK